MFISIVWDKTLNFAFSAAAGRKSGMCMWELLLELVSGLSLHRKFLKL